jgi:5-methylcytosine-specific restriction endonuclease McrA
MSRVQNLETWVNRLRRLCPITAISMELVCFDMQAMEHPDIQGCEYQQGTLAGYEVREYVLEKWNRTCSYCGKKDLPLQLEHIQAKANGGTNRVSNLCLACEACNLAKGTQDVVVFLAKKPDLLGTILAQAKAPLKDAAAVNATRWAVFERLKATGLPVECGSGGRTKFNRVSRGLPKTHWVDAACVGASTPPVLQVHQIKPLLIKATGYGHRHVLDGQIWLSAYQPQRSKAGQRLPNGRYRAGRRDHRRQDRDVSGQGRRSCDRIIQYHDARRNRTGH